jgi:hypothetical protein
MQQASKRSIPPELLDRILRTVIWKIGVEKLRKPSPQLSRRIEEGWKRFLWDIDVRAARTPLEQLAGLPSVDELLETVPFELPDLRKSKPGPSHIKLRAEYESALRQARLVFKGSGSSRVRARKLEKTCGIDKERFEGCATPRAAAIEVAKFRCADHLSAATVGDLVNSKPKSKEVALDIERRAAELDQDLTTAIRMELAKGDLQKQSLYLK